MIEMVVDGMNDKSYKKSVTKTLKTIKSVKKVAVDLDKGIVKLCGEDEQNYLDTVQELIFEMGLDVVAINVVEK
ncbi:MAG: heavy-metal-associated domain-containing protein [Christensenellaceae bacterium]